MMPFPPNNISPEVAGEVRALADRHEIRLRVGGDQGDYSCYADLITKEIYIGLEVFSYLWIQANAFIGLFSMMQQKCGKSISEAQGFYVFQTDESLQQSLRLWHRSHHLLIEQSPLELPKNWLGETRPKDAELAWHLAEMGIGWIYLHELFHHLYALGKTSSPPGLSSVQEELEADDFASTYALRSYSTYASSQAVDPDSVFIKRCLAICSVLQFIGGVEASRPGSSGSSHPNPFDRILHFLDRFSPATHGDKSDYRDYSWWFLGGAFNMLAQAEFGRPIVDLSTRYESPAAFLRDQFAAFKNRAEFVGCEPDAALGQVAPGLLSHLDGKLTEAEIRSHWEQPGVETLALITINITARGAISGGVQSGRLRLGRMIRAAIATAGLALVINTGGALTIPAAVIRVAMGGLVAWDFATGGKENLSEKDAVLYLSLWLYCDESNGISLDVGRLAYANICARQQAECKPRDFDVGLDRLQRIGAIGPVENGIVTLRESIRFDATRSQA